MKNGKQNNSSQTGPNFLSGQMSIRRNYKVGLLRFHRLRLGNMVIHRWRNKAGFLFVHTHRNHIGHTWRGKFGYHPLPRGVSGQNKEKEGPKRCVYGVIAALMTRQRVIDGQKKSRSKETSEKPKNSEYIIHSPRVPDDSCFMAFPMRQDSM